MSQRKMKKFLKTLAFVTGACIGAVLPFSSVAAEESTPVLSLEAAQKIATAAWQQCRSDGYSVSVAVVDRHGNVVTQLRDPQAGPHTVGSSFGKAFTSASMGRPTAKLTEAIAKNPSLAGLRDMDSRMVILPGGLPITVGDFRVGGIGVGGAPGGHLDVVCAEAGINALGDKK